MDIPLPNLALSSTEPPRRWLIPSGITIPLLIYAALVAVLWSFSIDDVAISFRYAHHLAAGQGLSWNPDGAPVEGYSNFLWVLILAVVGWLGVDIEVAAKIIGVLCGGVNLVLLFSICRRLWSAGRYWWLPTGLVALTPTWVAWAVSGLEIALFGTFLLICAAALVDASKVRAPLLSLGLGGLILTRPEGLVFAIIIVLLALMHDRERTWRSRGAALRYPILIVVAVAGALVVFRMLYYGSPLPNTVHAKFSLGLPGLPQAAQWALFALPFGIACGVALRDPALTSQRLLLRTALALAIVQIMITLTVVPVMSFLHRYQIALLPLIVLPVPLALQRLDRVRQSAGVVAVVLLAAWSLQDWFVVRERQAAEDYLRCGRRCIAEHLATLPAQSTVALVDAGCIPYWSDRPTLDVWGLCDREFARAGFSAAAVVARHPEVYVMSVDVTASGDLQPRLGMDRAMMNDSQFRERYGMWQYCLGGTTTTLWRYDYAILLDKVWASKQGLNVQSVR